MPAGEQDRVTPAGLGALARQVGLSGPKVGIAVAIALAESGGDPRATNTNNDRHRSVDVGLWQINTYWHPQYDTERLKEPLYNAQAMAAISKGGTDWTPWATFDNGRYREFIEEGGSAVDAPEVSAGEQAGELLGFANGWERAVLGIVLAAVFTAGGLTLAAIGLSKLTGVKPSTIAGPAGTAATVATLV
jgi:hypothetical protein